MDIIDQLAERHISEAMARGDFDNLPGSGKPLELDDDPLVPAELRTAYRVLKNAGYLPPELQTRRDIAQLEALLDCLDGDNKPAMQRRLRALQQRLAVMRGEGVDLMVEKRYREKLSRAMGAEE